MLRIAGIFVATITTFTCTAQGAPTSAGSAVDEAQPMAPIPAAPHQPSSTLEQVEQAYPKQRVGPVDLAIHGIELFAVHSDRPAPTDSANMPTIVGVIGGLGKPIVDGVALKRAVMSATNDPAILAQAVLAIDQVAASIVTSATTPEQQQAKVTAPAIHGTTLTFWVLTAGMGRQLRRATMDLQTGTLATAAPAVSDDAALDAAIAGIAGTSIGTQINAIRALAAACKTNDRARKALLDGLVHIKSDDNRGMVADVAASCGAAAVDPLIHVVETDASMEIRAKAAYSLGEIGDARARAVLQKAAKSADSGLVWAANHSLAKLK